MNHLDQKNSELANHFTEFATRNDAAQFYADLSATGKEEGQVLSL